MNSLGRKKGKEVGEQVIAQGPSGDGVDYPTCDDLEAVLLGLMLYKVVNKNEIRKGYPSKKMHNICECVYKSYKFLPYASILIQFRFLVIHDMACMRLSLSDMERLEGNEDGVGTRDSNGLLLLELHKIKSIFRSSRIYTQK